MGVTLELVIPVHAFRKTLRSIITGTLYSVFGIRCSVTRPRDQSLYIFVYNRQELFVFLWNAEAERQDGGGCLNVKNKNKATKI